MFDSFDIQIQCEDYYMEEFNNEDQRDKTFVQENS